MAKKIRIVLTLQLPAGKATPAPPVGTALGPHGINIVEFTKAYNERTAAQAGQVIPAQITIFEDRSFTFVLKTPPAADLLRKAAGVEKGSATAGRDTVGRITTRPGARDRDDQADRPQRQHDRGGDPPGRGHRAQHGHRGGRLASGDSDPPAGDHPGPGRHSVGEAGQTPAVSEVLHMAKHGKKYREAAALVDRQRVYAPDEAVELALKTNYTSFDATSRPTSTSASTPAMRTRWSEVRSCCPHGTGKKVRVAVFAQGEKAQEALRAGADEVGSEDLVKKIEAGWLEFDVALATPDTMGMVGRLGRILGRRGLMPNPKSGTITFDLDRAIREVKAGRVEFKVDKGGLIHVPAGKTSFEADQLVANLAALLDAVNRAKPSGAKGQYLKGMTIAATMGPGIKVDIPALLAVAAAN